MKVIVRGPSYCARYAGQVTEKHTETATIESKGKPITKKGEPENPAFKVERKGKNPVIKKACTRPRLPCESCSWHVTPPWGKDACCTE